MEWILLEIFSKLDDIFSNIAYLIGRLLGSKASNNEFIESLFFSFYDGFQSEYRSLGPQIE